MKRSNKGFDYCYNAQAVVDSGHQIIVAAETTAAANDKQQAVPLAQAALENLAAAGIELPRDEQGQLQPIPNTADSGYFSEANVREVTTLPSWRVDGRCRAALRRAVIVNWPSLRSASDRGRTLVR